MDAARARFTDLYGAHYRKVLGYVQRRVDSQATAQDLTEEIFLVAWRRLETVPPEPEAEYWLYGVARNVVSAHRRKVRNRSRIFRRWLVRAPQLPDSPEELVVRNEAARTVLDALYRLPDRDRELIRLAYWEELPHSAIAGLLGLTRTNVDVRLHRAIRRLAKELDRSGHVPDEGLPLGAPKESEC